MTHHNGSSNQVDKISALLAHLRNLREMEAGIVAGKEGETRLEVDPQGAIDQLADYAAFAAQELRAGPVDWKSTLNVKPIRATELAPLIDMPVPYILKPLIVEGSLTQIQGIPKGGKSAFSVYISFCLATGTWPFPQYLAATEPTEVLYLAWEDPALMMAKRLSLFAVGLGHQRTFMPEKLTFLFGPDLFIERGDHEAALRSAIEELKPKVIFIDTLSHIHNCEENSSTEMKIPMRSLARVAEDCKVGIVYLHHTGKSEREHAQAKSRGSGAIAAAWHVLVDWGVRDKGSNVNPVEIQSKYEHSWKHWAIGYETDDKENPTWVKWNFDSGESSTEKGISSTDRKRIRLTETIRKLHETNEWVTAKQVTDTCNLGLHQKVVQRHLRDMCEDGILECKVPETPKDPLHYKLVYSNGGGNLTDYQ